MSKNLPVAKPAYGLLPTDIVGFDSLAELALDMRSSWNHATDTVWRQLDPALWDITHNPWVVLQTASREKIEGVLADPAFRKNIDAQVATRRQRAANKGAVGRQIVDWQHSLEQKWGGLRFGEVKVETHGEQHIFEVPISLNSVDPKAVRVEIFADGVTGGAPLRQEMKLVRQLDDALSSYVYRAAVSAARPPADYTARVMPHCDGVAIPLENARILWQR
jgi:hypothetical protein